MNYFELYGLPVSFHPDPAAVKNKYYELSRKHHPDRFAQAGGNELADALRMAAANNDAYKTLRSADATMAYILKLHGLLEDEEKYSLPPAFLMEMMDLNEAVSDYEMEPANEQARQLALGATKEQLQAWAANATALTTSYNNSAPDNALLIQVKDMYFRKKYLLRIQERIDKFATR
ncbi:MAG: iron-sulfur cluster co-chaperone HscB C-terminal domain-containing protein [Bacteroidota bacterium]